MKNLIPFASSTSTYIRYMFSESEAVKNFQQVFPSFNFIWDVFKYV